MKSIKPGRGQSAMGFIGSVIAIIFGVFWTFTVATVGAPIILPLFGVLFIIVGIVQAVYHYKNTTGKNRYSVIDITEDGEEIDPLDQRFGNIANQSKNFSESNSNVEYCPYCGTKANDDYDFCSKCGKKLP